MVTTYIARRRLKMAPEIWREPDQLVPEAVLWPRYESWLHTGHIREVEVEVEAFESALEDAQPPLTELEKTRIRDITSVEHAPRVAPFTRTRVLEQAATERLAQVAVLDVPAVPVPARRGPRAAVVRAAPGHPRQSRKRPAKVTQKG